MSTTRLITCENLTEAYLIKGKLNNEGIDCFLTNENFTNLMPIYNNMLGAGIQIFVDDNDLDKARALINDKLEPDNGDLDCPYCGSKEIELGIGENKRLKIFNILLSLLAFIPLGNMKPKYFCKNCRKEIK